MPYKNKPRPYKKEYKQQKARGEHEARMERQRARRRLDKKGVNRKGKDIAHKKALSSCVIDEQQNVERQFTMTDLKDLFTYENTTICDTHDRFKCRRCVNNIQVIHAL